MFLPEPTPNLLLCNKRLCNSADHVDEKESNYFSLFSPTRSEGNFLFLVRTWKVLLAYAARMQLGGGTLLEQNTRSLPWLAHPPGAWRSGRGSVTAWATRRAGSSWRRSWRRRGPTTARWTSASFQYNISHFHFGIFRDNLGRILVRSTPAVTHLVVHIGLVTFSLQVPLDWWAVYSAATSRKSVTKLIWTSDNKALYLCSFTTLVTNWPCHLLIVTLTYKL